MKDMIETLLRKVTSNNHMVRKYAIQALGVVKISSRLKEKVIRTLINALNDSNGEVRKATLLTLDRLIQRDDIDLHGVNEPLIKDVSDILNHHSDPAVLSHAIGILTVLTIQDQRNGKAHGTTLIGRITTMLEDHNANVRIAGLKSIVELFKAGANIVSSIDNIIRYVIDEQINYLRRLRENGSVLQGNCLRDKLKKILSYFDVIATSSEEEKKGGRTDFILILNQLLDNPNGKKINIIISLIRRIYTANDPHFLESHRAEIVRKLISFGMQTQNEEVETSIAQSLRKIYELEGPDSPISKSFFFPLNSSQKEDRNLFGIAFDIGKSSQVSFWGAKFLGVIFEHREVPSTIVDFIENKLGQQFSAIKVKAIIVIREISRGNPEFSDYIYKAMYKLADSDKEIGVRLEATKTLGRLKVNAKGLSEIVTVLLGLLGAENEELKVTTARSLERLSSRDSSIPQKAAVPLLNLSLQESPSSRIFVEILGVFYHRSDQVDQIILDQLIDGIENKSDLAKENALWLISILVQRNDHLDFSSALDFIYSTYRDVQDPFLKRQLIQSLLSLFHHPSVQEHQVGILNLLLTVLEDNHLLVSEAASLSLDNLFKKLG